MLVRKTLENELNVSLTAYKIIRVDEGNHPNDFETLLLYEVQDFDLYNKHYFRPDVEMLMPEKRPQLRNGYKMSEMRLDLVERKK